MDIATTLITTFVMVAVGGFLTYVTIDRYRQLRLELKGDIARLDEGLARLEARMDAGFTVIRSDLTAVALAVGARPPSVSGDPGRA